MTYFVLSVCSFLAAVGQNAIFCIGITDDDEVTVYEVECPFASKLLTATYESNNFTISPSDGTQDAALLGSNISVTHENKTKYIFSAPGGVHFEPKQICFVTSCQKIKVVFTGESIVDPIIFTQLGYTEEIPYCVEESALEQLTVNKIKLIFIDQGTYVIRDILIQACTEPAECGYSKFEDAGIEGGTIPEPSIVGGWLARTHEFPWQVILRIDADNTTYWCGGSIIDRYYVLTAAHCLYFSELSLTVFAGVDSLYYPNDHVQTFAAQAITLHKYYDNTELYNDIALIRLADPGIVEWSEAIFPICLPTVPSCLRESVNAPASGWGATVWEGPGPVADLRYTTNMPVLSFTECDECINARNELLNFLEHGINYTVDIYLDGMMCAGFCGPNDRSTCQGDSGGPLKFKNEDGLWELLGVTSWGFECADEAPSVYSDVYFYKKWINDNTQDAENSPLFP